MKAVLTGDIVNSTQLGAAREKKLLRLIAQVLSPHKYEFYRGDSFQAYVTAADKGLMLALQCRMAAISLSDELAPPAFDIRVSIGIGPVQLPVKTLSTAKGEAFVLSGRAFDKIEQQGEKLAIITGNPLANEGLQVIADYINAILNNMTVKQAAVIFELLNGHTQQTVAERMKRSKSTIHQHVTAGRWPEIEKLLRQYENIIHQLT